MSLLKRLFGKDEPPGEEHREEQHEPEVEQVQKEEQQLLHELAETRQRLLIIEQRKAEYILDEHIPMQLDIEEARIRERVAELENRCMALGIEPVEDALMMKDHLTHLLAKARENLLLIESRKEKQKNEADISIQLSKAEHRWRARIAELENEIGEE